MGKILMTLYYMLFVMQFESLFRKVDKCSYDELETDLPQDLFSSLNLNRENLRLDLDYQNFEI